MYAMITEQQLRRALKKIGYALRKSRSKVVSLDDLDGYMIVDGYTNGVVAGSNFNLNLDEAKEWLQYLESLEA